MTNFDRCKALLCAPVLVLAFASHQTARAQENATAASTNLAATETGQLVVNGAVPRLIKFSGVITDPDGKPATGTVSVTFNLYKEEEGSALWTETQSLQLDAQGHYTVLLGAASGAGLPLDQFASANALWLGVQPNLAGESELPRVLLVAVPYALKAVDADTLGGKPASAYMLSQSSGTSPSAQSIGVGLKAGTLSSGQPATVTSHVSAVNGSGLPNFIPVWTGTETLGDSILFYANNNIGVGIKTPGARLDSVSTSIAVRGTTSGVNESALVGISNATTGYGSGVSGTGATTGVSGNAFATSGYASGVYGTSASTSGSGVSGFTTATTGYANGVYGQSASNAGSGLSGYASAATGNTSGVYGHAVSTNGTGVYGASDNWVGVGGMGATLGVWGDTASVGGQGVAGYSDATSGSGQGVYGQSASAGGIGVVGVNTSSVGGTGVIGVVNSTTGGSSGVMGTIASTSGAGVNGNATATSGINNGVYGQSASTSGVGVSGNAVATSGYTSGIYGQSSSPSGYGVNGNAIATTGYNVGVYGQTESTSGYGVYGLANPTGSGGAGAIGVIGINLGSNGSAGSFGAISGDGLILQGWGSGFNQVFTVDANGNLDISGNLTVSGSKSARVKLQDGRNVALYAVESPENWFEDFGSASLHAGAAQVSLDSGFLQTVDTTTDYHVFLTPKGDCHGLYVASTSAAGFVVRELGSGSSSIAFDYRIVAHRRGFETVRLQEVKLPQGPTDMAARIAGMKSIAHTAAPPRIAIPAVAHPAVPVH